MALNGWLLDKSAAARADQPSTRQHLEELAALLYLCPVGELEQLDSSRRQPTLLRRRSTSSIERSDCSGTSRITRGCGIARQYLTS